VEEAMMKHSLSQPLPTSAFPGPDDTLRTELPNGIVVLARANFNSPSVFLAGYLPAGSLFDPDDKLGLADFTALALMRGTARHSFQQIFNLLETAGANLGIDSGTHTTAIGGRSLAVDLPLILKLLAEALRQPSFPKKPVERLRAQLLTGLAIRAQDTTEMASLAFDQLVYAGHPYSRPDDGNPETIQAITRTDLEAFHARHYGPRKLVLAIAGAVDPPRAVEQVAQALGDWHNPDQPEPPPLPPLIPLNGIITRHVEIPGKHEADLLLGAAGPLRRSPDFLAASLGNHILGQFGLYGRIGMVVREQAGLAYSVSSSLSGGIGPGPWLVSAGVAPENVEQAIDLIRREIARFVSQPVTAEELADSQSSYIGRLPLSLESNGGVAGALLSLERYGLGLDYYPRFAGLVASVTPEDVLEAAGRYLHPDRLAIATAGTFSPTEAEP
jgi:zinc protease